MSQVNISDSRIAFVASNLPDEAVIGIKHDYKGDCSRNNDEFIEYLSLMLGTEIDSSSLLNARDGFVWIKIDYLLLSAVGEDTLPGASTENFEDIAITSQVVSNKQDAVRRPKLEASLAIEALQLLQETSRKLISDKIADEQAITSSFEFSTPFSMQEKDNTDEMEQQSSKTIKVKQEEAIIQLHNMNEKMLSSIDTHQNQTIRNRQEIKHLDNEIEQVLESINS
ncbi:MAG: hypothetical protein AAFO95_10080 [Cyanobacteria bacterium J06600_6]